MRLINTLATLLVLLMSGMQLSAQIVTYALTADGTPTTVDPNASAINLTSVGVGSPGFGVNGVSCNGWSLAGLDAGKYFQIAVSPNAGYDMNITDLNFSERRSNTGIRDYQVQWSKSASFTSPTTIATVNVPDNDLVRSGNISGLNIDVLDGETIYFRFFGYNAESSGGTWRIQSNTLAIIGTLTTPAVTNVSFSAVSATVDEGDGTYSLNVSITNPDLVNSTIVDVVLISGDAARVNGFTSTTLTFPAGSSANQTATITITDAGDCDGDADIMFELQNVSGGFNAAIAIPDQFTLNIIDNDTQNENVYVNDFESGAINGWSENVAGAWVASASSPINGSYSMKHNLVSVAGTSYTTMSLNDLDLNAYETTWRFQLANGAFDPSTNNKFWVYLASSSTNLANSGGADGYAVGINLTGSSDILTLSRVANGNSSAALVTSTFDWDADDVVGIEVTRTVDGLWTLSFDDNGGFDALVSAGSATDNTYTTASYFGLNFVHTVSFSGLLRLDDVSITNSGCFPTYYSQLSGFTTGNIWDITPVGSGGPATFSRHNNFVVQNGHTVELDGNLEMKDLTIDAGGTFDLTGSGDRLTVAGSWINNGTFISQVGRVKMIGNSGTSIISGNNEFFDLEINHLGSGVDLNDDTDIWGTLLLTQGVLDVNGNILTLRSDASNTASVGPIENGSVSGNVTVERYIESGPTGWRNMGASVSGATLQAWNDHFTTTGIPGSDYPNWPSPANRFPSVKSYDETDLGDREIGWRAATHMNNSIADGQGFWMYIGGVELPATVDITGTLITGEQTLNLDYTPDLGAFHDGWNLVSNMYAATIDWDSPDFDRTGLEDGVWIWNSTVQQYGSYISGVGIHGVNNEIAHSQSFWVHANAASPTLTFRESIKSNNNNASWIKSNGEIEQGIVRLKLTGNGFYDETALVLNDEATIGYEGTHDAMKFFTPNELVPSLATVVASEDELYDLAINSLPYPSGEFSVPMKALTGTSGTYVLSVESVTGMEMSTCIAIEDLQTGETISLTAGESMEIQLDAADSTARFIIHLGAPISVSKTDNSCFNSNDGSAEVIGIGEGPWSYVWTNEEGEELQTSANSTSSDVINGLPQGTYFVEVSGNTSACPMRIETFEISAPLEGLVTFETENPGCNIENGNIFVQVNGGAGNWNLLITEDQNTVFEAVMNEGEEATANLPKGSYVVIAENACSTQEFEVELNDPQAVLAGFEASALEVSIAEGGVITLTNSSLNATHFLWEMGDGITYTTDDVIHMYTEPGTYIVQLTSFGLFCQDITTKEITVTDVALSDESLNDDTDMNIYFNGMDIVIDNPVIGSEMNIQLHDILGKTLLSTQSFQPKTFIPIGDKGYPAGVYFVTVNGNNQIKSKKILIAK